MKLLVIDASIAAKWFIAEPGSKQASKILYDIEKKPGLYYVPELFYIEILNVLSKTNINTKQLQEKMELLENLGINRTSHSHELLTVAAKYTKEFELSAYDATYAALAALIKGKWLTADYKAFKKIRSLSIAQVL